MSFKPCVLIPIYNHKERIRGTVERLLPHALPIFVVDDGSDDATRAVLAVLASEQPLLRLLRLPENAGKGAAVMAGMRAARRAGFSHALQVDADGQHDLADVPRFLERGFANPEAVVCGKALYDHTVPRSRRYGRYLTHFWVWVETLSLAIGDSMCGFRLYPLAASCALIALLTAWNAAQSNRPRPTPDWFVTSITGMPGRTDCTAILTMSPPWLVSTTIASAE